jgi:hypothetical protein
MLFFYNTQQLQGIFEQVCLVITPVLRETLCAKPVDARRASVVLWA